MVIALVGLIFILLLVFVLIIRGQSKKYAKKTDSGELGPSPAGQTGLPLFWQGGPGVRSLLGRHLPCEAEQPGPLRTASISHLVSPVARERESTCHLAGWGRGGQRSKGVTWVTGSCLPHPAPTQGAMPSLVASATGR